MSKSEALPRGRTSRPMIPRSTRLHHRNLLLLLLQARERVLSHFRPILNANGVTDQQWRIVRVLYEVPSLEPREIVELCRISSPSMAGVLARMEELGLVVRRRLPHDQLLATLEAQAPRRVDGAAPLEIRRRRRRSAAGRRTRGAVQQLSEGRS